MSKLIESLIKIAAPLYNTSMSDRYSNPTNKAMPATAEAAPPNPYTAPRKSYSYRDAPSKLKKLFKPKFNTAAPSSLKVTPKTFDYLSFSKNTNFAALAPFIINRESGGNSYISRIPNKDGTSDYGLYQINDLNLSRKTSGGKLADEFDPIFEKYYQHYQTNFAGKNIDGVDYAKLDKDSLDVDTRRKLLQIKHKDFNDSKKSLSFDLSEKLYNQRGIGQWAAKENIIKDYNDSLQVASSD